MLVAAALWPGVGQLPVGVDLRAAVAHEFSLSLGDWTLALDLREWVNDGLMALFFFVVALEIKRELVVGRAAGSATRRRCRPSAAVGGMVVPAAHLPRDQRRRRSGAEAGASRWRPTSPSPSACWPCSAAGSPRAAPVPADPGDRRRHRRHRRDRRLLLDDVELGWLVAAAGVVAAVAALRRPGHRRTRRSSWPSGVVLWLLVHASGRARHDRRRRDGSAGAGRARCPRLGRASSTTLDELRDVFSPEAARATVPDGQRVGVAARMARAPAAPVDELVIVPLFALANAGVPLLGDVADAAPSSGDARRGGRAGRRQDSSASRRVRWLAVRLGVAALPAVSRWRPAHRGRRASPASASPCRCSSPGSRSTTRLLRTRPRSASWPHRSPLRYWAPSCCAPAEPAAAARRWTTQPQAKPTCRSKPARSRRSIPGDEPADGRRQPTPAEHAPSRTRTQGRTVLLMARTSSAATPWVVCHRHQTDW